VIESRGRSGCGIFLDKKVLFNILRGADLCEKDHGWPTLLANKVNIPFAFCVSGQRLLVPNPYTNNRAQKSRKMGMSSGGKFRNEHESAQQGQSDKAAELDGKCTPKVASMITLVGMPFQSNNERDQTNY